MDQIAVAVFCGVASGGTEGSEGSVWLLQGLQQGLIWRLEQMGRGGDW